MIIVAHNMQQAARISNTTDVFLTGDELAEYDDTTTIFEERENQRGENCITEEFG